MLDKSIPYTGVLMTKRDCENYPIHTLPAGFRICGYRPGLEREWAQIHKDLTQVESLEAGLALFRSEFMDRPQWLPERCPFVLDPDGRAAALGSLWDGDQFGKIYPRLHWIACRPDCQGKGLVKALLTRLMQLHETLYDGDFLYLVSQTWSYKALDLYRKFGFKPYKGEKPVNWKSEDFPKENSLAWERINEKIAPKAPF